MFKRLITTLVAILFLSSSFVANAEPGERRLGVAPVPDQVDVTATTWVTLTDFNLTGTPINYSMGVMSVTYCWATVTVKDSAASELKIRILFGTGVGLAVANPQQTIINSDGSISRIFMGTNPPGNICLTRLQVAKTSANIQLTAAPAPPAEDIFSLSVQ